MHKIIQANVDHYQDLLKSEADPVKRAAIIRLLAEETEKMKTMAEVAPKPE